MPATRYKPSTANTIKAKDAFFQQLLLDGVDTIFGNPGTVEEAIIDTLPDYPEMRYIMGLQEAAITGVADAYARATKKPAFVQVHASVGLGNAMGILYAAKQCYTPMIMYAGETYADLLDYYGFLGGDTVAIAKPVTKWADRVSHPSQLLRNLRRAFKIAMTPPQGPVFLAIPMNVLDAEIPNTITPSSYVDPKVVPNSLSVQSIAKRLLEADDPLLLIGDQIHLTNAQEEVHEIAHLVGIPIYGVEFTQMNASFKDPLFMGLTGHLFADRTLSITREADVALAVGTPLFPELFPTLEPYFREDACLMQIDLNDWELGKNFSTELTLRCDPKLSLRAVADCIRSTITTAQQERAAERRRTIALKKAAQYDQIESHFAPKRGQSPMSMPEAMEAIAKNLPLDVVVYDESITAIMPFLHYFQPEQVDSYYMCRGGCLGQGLPGGIGIKLAYPERPVAALVGDGASMYTNQALWTAAHYKMKGLVFFIINNRSYRILKTNLVEYWKRTDIPIRDFHNLDINDPAIDFVKLAESMGVTGHRVETPEALAALIPQVYEADGPQLVEIIVDGSVNPNEATFV